MAEVPTFQQNAVPVWTPTLTPRDGCYETHKDNDDSSEKYAEKHAEDEYFLPLLTEDGQALCVLGLSPLDPSYKIHLPADTTTSPATLQADQKHGSNPNMLAFDNLHATSAGQAPDDSFHDLATFK